MSAFHSRLKSAFDKLLSIMHPPPAGKLSTNNRFRAKLTEAFQSVGNHLRESGLNMGDIMCWRYDESHVWTWDHRGEPSNHARGLLSSAAVIANGAQMFRVQHVPIRTRDGREESTYRIVVVRESTPEVGATATLHECNVTVLLHRTEVQPELLDQMGKIIERFRDWLLDTATHCPKKPLRLTIDLETNSATLDGQTFSNIAPNALRALKVLVDAQGRIVSGSKACEQLNCQDKTLRRWLQTLPRQLRDCIKSKTGAGRWLQLP